MKIGSLRIDIAVVRGTLIEKRSHCCANTGWADDLDEKMYINIGRVMLKII